MASVTVTIEGDIGEVMAMIGQIAGGSNIASQPQPVSSPMPAESAPPPKADVAASASAAFSAPVPPPQLPLTDWNISYVNTFWRNLSDTARQAMLRVSRSPNHMQKRTHLMNTLHLSQRELSGSLSSQGHSMNRLRKRRGEVDLPRPLIYDKGEDAYVLDSKFAVALREMGIT